MNVLVVCGTHHQPFDALVREAASLVDAGHAVTIQRGTSTVDPRGCTVVDVVSPAALSALADAADVIVGHAAPGVVFLAWERGRCPVLVPRRRHAGEHVDDHQVAFAARVAGRAVVVDSQGLDAAVRRAAATVVPPVPGVASPGFVRAFSALVDDLVDPARHNRR